VLDATKSGLRLRPDILREHSRTWTKTLGPEWKDKVDDKKKGEKNREDNRPFLKRSMTKSRFVMDEITRLADKKANEELAAMKETFGKFKTVVDTDLTAPWLRMREIARRYAEEEGNFRLERDMKVIEDHVRRMRELHRDQIGLKGPGLLASPRKEGKGAAFTDLPIEQRQDKIRAMSQKFASRPGPDEVLLDENEIQRLRASYAYCHDMDKRTSKGDGTRFPFDVAMRELCAIKGTCALSTTFDHFSSPHTARALGPSKTITSSFYERFYLR
jgi:RNA-dependent RNA polymerase